MVTCSACGTKVEEKFRFCPSCGQNMNAKNTVVTVCRHCGVRLRGTFRYCPSCGQKNEAFREEKDIAVDRTKIRMIPVAAGSFTMGNARTRFLPVELPAFMISSVPVIQMFYEKVMGCNPSKIKGPLNPVESLSWFDAVIFCNRVSEMYGYKPCYSINGETKLEKIEPSDSRWSGVACDFSADGFRLPTEAEWEFAARGGEKFIYAGSDDVNEVAWYGENSDIQTHPVSEKKCNAFGIYDMSGNVEEWCNDWAAQYGDTAQTDPKGPETGTLRIKRGGCWLDDAQLCEIRARSFAAPNAKAANLGFRICRRQ